jgi:hypothetical protein
MLYIQQHMLHIQPTEMEDNTPSNEAETEAPYEEESVRQPIPACRTTVQGNQCQGCEYSHDDFDIEAELNAQATKATPIRREACRAFNNEGCALPQHVPGLGREQRCAFEHRCDHANELLRRQHSRNASTHCAAPGAPSGASGHTRVTSPTTGTSSTMPW